MRKIIATMWITLDGYVAEANGGMNFVGQFYDQDMGEYETNLVKEADTLMLGRSTYESFSGSWPLVAENPEADEGERAYARILNGMHKVVFSKTLESADWKDSTLYREIKPDEIKALKAQPGKDIVIYGSVSIIRQLTSLGLIDEYQLLVHPIFLGSGKPLFADTVTLKQVSSKTFSSGVTLLTYQRA